MKTSNEITKVSSAIVKAQAAIKTVTKDAANTFFKKADGSFAPYATLDAIIEACKEALAKNNLAVIQFPTEDGGKYFVTTRVQHESGEYFEDNTPLLLGKQDMQGFGAAVTYAKRFALGSFFNIATEVDDDGNKASEGAKGNPEKPKNDIKRQEMLKTIDAGMKFMKKDMGQYLEHLSTLNKRQIKAVSDLNDSELSKAVVAMNQWVDKEKTKQKLDKELGLKNENTAANQ